MANNTKFMSKWTFKGVTYTVKDAEARSRLDTVEQNMVTSEEGKGLSTNDFTDAYKTKVDETASSLSAHTSNKSNPHGVTASQVGLGNVTNDKQVKGRSSGTTAGNVVAWGADGYNLQDTGFTIGKSVPSDAEFTDTKYTHPTINAETTQANQSVGHGETFKAISAMNVNTEGHVTDIVEKTFTLPNETELTVEESGSGDVISGISVSGHKITVTKNTALTADHEHPKYENQNAFSNILVGDTILAAENTTDVFEIAAGENVTLTADEAGDTITIAAKDTTYVDATTSKSGLMSADDKTKLNGIAEGAQVNTLTGVKGAAESSYRIGNVNITPANIGLGNVTNESKETMFENAALTGTPTAPTAGADTDSTQIATTAFVQSVVSSKIAAADAMIYKGTIGSSGATISALPATHKTGWSYKVITAGTYAGQKCEVGDLIICLNDGTAAKDSDWTVVQSNIDGAVIGPENSVNAHVVTFDGATGKVIKDSGFTIGASIPSDAVFTDTTYSDATTGKSGLMSAADKTKLNGIEAGAQVNQNAYAVVKVGDATLSADSTGDTLTLIAGDNVTLTPDENGDAVTISATDMTYTHPTYSGRKLTGSQAPGHGGTFGVVSSLTLANGHVSGYIADTVTLPEETKLSKSESGSGNAITDIAVNGHGITVTKGKTFSESDHTHNYAGAASAGGAANKAINDENGNPITGYVTGLSVSGKTITFTKGDGTSDTLTTQDTTYNHPSYSAKSEGLYKVTVDNLGHVSAVSAVTKDDITGLGIPAQDTTYVDATTSKSGLMSADDKSKLNGIEAGAQVNTVTGVKGGSESSYRTGNINITAANIGLGNVTNESKATMFNDAALTGAPTAPTAGSDTNTTQIATTAFVQALVDSKIAAADAMIYKGTIGTTGTVTLLPAQHKTGWTYKVVTAAEYAGQKCEVGDLIICLKDGTTSLNSDWTVVQTNIDGAVTGPASSVAEHIAVFSGTTGKVVKDSGFTIGKSVPSDAVFTDTVYSHPTYSGSKLTGSESPEHGGSFSVVSAITLANGHVSGYTANMISLPEETTLSKTDSGSGNAVTGITVSGHGITVTKDKTFSESGHTHNYAGAASSGGAATKAINDNSGNEIAATYIKDLSISGKTITFTKGNGDTDTITTQDTVYTHPTYTAKSAGLYKVTVDGMGHVSAATAVTKDDITGLGIPAQDTTYDVATTSANGLMSKDDKSKLDGIAAGAQVNTVTGVKGNSESSYRTGNINITAANVGLGNVTNESKATMFTSPTFTGTPKAPTADSGTNTTQIATTAFVQAEIDSKIAAADAMIYKGTIGSSGATITALPTTHKTGWSYKVITAGTYAGVACEVGDIIICLTDGTANNNSDWTVVQTNIDGAVTGPASSVANRVAVFNGTTGKVIKDSGYTIAKSVPSDAVFTDTVYTHPSYTAKNAGLYKVTVDGTGHVSAATAVTKDDITGLGIPAQDTTYDVASTSANGLMSKDDKSKLDGIAAGANAYTHPSYTAKSEGLYKVTVDGTGHVSTATAVTKDDITALGIPAQDTVYSLPDATGSVKGGVIVGSNLTVSSGTLSLTKANVTGALGYTPPKRLVFTNKVVATSAWVADETYTGFGYKAAIACDGVTADYLAEVIFNVDEVIAGIYAPVNETGSGTVTIWASELPSADITIPTISCLL